MYCVMCEFVNHKYFIFYFDFYTMLHFALTQLYHTILALLSLFSPVQSCLWMRQMTMIQQDSALIAELTQVIRFPEKSRSSFPYYRYY